MKRDYWIFIGSVLAGFLLLFLGAYFSPTFSEQQSFIEAMVMFGALLFIFSVVVILSAFGFHSFALFMALFIAMAISLYGVKAGVMALFMIYLIWGFVFSLQLLLVSHKIEASIRWFKERYNFKTFNYEYRAFYPMLWLTYFFFEYLPHLITREHRVKFSPKSIKELMQEVL